MFELPIKFYFGCFFLLCAWFTKEKLPEDNIGFWLNIGASLSFLLPILLLDN